MYGERLKFLRLRKGVTQKEISDIVGVAPSTYTLYENEKREPDFSTLIALAEYFSVSCDYILGYSDFENSQSEFKATNDPDSAFDFLYSGCNDQEKRYIYCLFLELANAIAFWQDRGSDGAMLLTEYFTAIIDCTYRACTDFCESDKNDAEDMLLVFLASINHVVADVALKDFKKAPFVKKLFGDVDVQSLLEQAGAINNDIALRPTYKR